jgi:hypothetical protein
LELFLDHQTLFAFWDFFSLLFLCKITFLFIF